MTTIDGQQYRVAVTQLSANFTASGTTIYPFIVCKRPDQVLPSVFTTTPSLRSTVVTDLNKPFLPLYLTYNVRTLGNNIISFATPYLVNLVTKETLTGLQAPKTVEYGGKIVPWCQQDIYALRAPTTAGTNKQWIGAVTCPLVQQIEFHSQDFIYDSVAYLVPTDTQYNYLNYNSRGTPATIIPSAQSNGGLYYTVVNAQAYVISCTLTYLILI
jgi:hypothetical protein